MSVRPRSSGLLLVPAAALVVHQARYTLAYGSHANAELAAQGHSYLNSVIPWTILALGLGASAFLHRLARTTRTGDHGRFSRVSAPALWLLTTAGLIVIYSIQETLEGMMISGHPGGVAGVFGHGGWWAVPVAALVSVAVVALLQVGRAMLRLAVGLAPPHARKTLARLLFPVAPMLLVPAPLARAAAGRAPPHVRS
jgi:hypothetical protein